MRRSPRVLMLVENLPVPFDRRVWLEATTLRDNGYQVSVICPKGAHDFRESRIRLDGINVYRYQLPSTATGFASYAREYAVAMLMTFLLSIHVLVHEGFDVIHACNPPDLFFIIGAFYRLLGKKYIFDQHDLSPETFRVQFRGRYRLVYLLLRALEWLTYRTADAVISTNESIRDIAHRRGGVPAQRLFVVRSGPDFERLYLVPPDPDLRRGKRHLVVYLGIMGPQDGVDLALRAADVILHSHRRRDIHFAFVGDGDHLPMLRQLTQQLGLDDIVEFAGLRYGDDLRRYLSTADVGIAPDPANGLNEFHTHNKVMEYMAMRLPVVAFDIGETQYSAGEAALYALPNDVDAFAAAIIRLLEHPDLCARLGAAGQARIERDLGWHVTHRQLLQAYRFVFRNQDSSQSGPAVAGLIAGEPAPDKELTAASLEVPR